MRPFAGIAVVVSIYDLFANPGKHLLASAKTNAAKRLTGSRIAAPVEAERRRGENEAPDPE